MPNLHEHSDTENLQKSKDFKETKVCQPQHS